MLDCASVHYSVNAVWIDIGLCKRPFWCVDSRWTEQASILVLCGFTLDCASINYNVVTGMNSCWTVQEFQCCVDSHLTLDLASFLSDVHNNDKSNVLNPTVIHF